jgi:hypothetical protein
MTDSHPPRLSLHLLRFRPTPLRYVPNLHTTRFFSSLLSLCSTPHATLYTIAIAIIAIIAIIATISVTAIIRYYRHYHYRHSKLPFANCLSRVRSFARSLVRSSTAIGHWVVVTAATAATVLPLPQAHSHRCAPSSPVISSLRSSAFACVLPQAAVKRLRGCVRPLRFRSPQRSALSSSFTFAVFNHR